MANRVLPAGIYLLKVDNRNTRTRCEIRSKLTIKTPERHLIVNFEHVIAARVIDWILIVTNIERSTIDPDPKSNRYKHVLTILHLHSRFLHVYQLGKERSWLGAVARECSVKNHLCKIHKKTPLNKVVVVSL